MLKAKYQIQRRIYWRCLVLPDMNDLLKWKYWIFFSSVSCLRQLRNGYIMEKLQINSTYTKHINCLCCNSFVPVNQPLNCSEVLSVHVLLSWQLTVFRLLLAITSEVCLCFTLYDALSHFKCRFHSQIIAFISLSASLHNWHFVSDQGGKLNRCFEGVKLAKHFICF